MITKEEKEKIKAELEKLGEERKAVLKELLGVPPSDKDPDLVDAVLKLEKRIETLEEKLKKPEKPKGFLSDLFGG